MGRAARLAAFALALAVPVALGMAVMMTFEEDLIFPTRSVPRAGPLPAAAETLRVTAADGTALAGTFIPAAGRGDRRLLVYGLAGNAWNAADLAAMLHRLLPEADVATFHYRGYAPSGGKPSAAALIADAPLALDAARARAEPERTIVVGLSLGSGVAATLAAERPVDGLVLVTPFDSLRAVAADAFPWFPVGALFRNEIDAAAALREVEVPVAIIAAERDTLILPRRTAALRTATRRLAFDRTIARAGHNDIYFDPRFRSALREALAALVKE